MTEFGIVELETIEAPLTDTEIGVILGVETVVLVAELGALAAVCAC
ncbi:MAG: hypothetical protein K6B15_03595 [Parasporobacterium sp.]|nr:hypothetical protein [Parasporobacterium sp.]